MCRLADCEEPAGILENSSSTHCTFQPAGIPPPKPRGEDIIILEVAVPVACQG